MMRRLSWLLILIFFPPLLFAQMSLGLVNGNYSGSNGSIINPASMANTQLKADINILTVHTFVENNYFYFPSKKASLLSLFNGAYSYEYHVKPYGQGVRQVYTYYQDKSLKNIFVNSRVIGPSFMYSYKDHVFGVRTGFRVVSSTRRLPYDIANFSYYGMDFKPQQNVYYIHDNYDMASMAWAEIMFSYATVLKRNDNNMWSVGISAGPAFGNSGAYMMGGNTSYICYNDSILNVETLNMEYGLSLPADYDRDLIDFFDPIIRGAGWGMNIGFSWQHNDRPYQKKAPGSCYKKSFEDYKIKVGFSLLDIGWINYSVNTEKHVFDNVHNNWIRTNLLKYSNIRGALNTASELFYNDPDESLRSRRMKIYMPATVSVQLDYKMGPGWYFNSTLMLPARYASPMVEYPIVLALTPRYESYFFEVNVPVVLYDFKYPRVGLSVRIQGLTVGTDNLGSLTTINDFTGADIYVSYKINLRQQSKHPYLSRGACYSNFRHNLKKSH